MKIRKVSMHQLLPASTSKKKKKKLDEARMWQILHRDKGSLFASSLQSRCVTPSLRMLPDLAQKVSELSAAGDKPASWRSIVKAWPDLTLFQSLLLPASAVQGGVLFWPATVSFQNNCDKFRNWSREYCWAFQHGLEQWPTKVSSYLQYAAIFIKILYQDAHWSQLLPSPSETVLTLAFPISQVPQNQVRRELHCS